MPRLPDGTALIGDSAQRRERRRQRHPRRVDRRPQPADHVRRRDHSSRTPGASSRGTGSGWCSTSSCPRRSARSSRRRSSRGDQRLFPRGCHPFIPVEFPGAAYRFGHSQVRPSYRDELRPAARTPRRASAWSSTARRSRPPTRPTCRAGRGSGPLRRLADVLRLRRRPRAEGAAEQADRHQALDAAVPLAARDCRGPEDALAAPASQLPRHLTWSLPSGQAIAKKLGLPALSTDQLADVGRV